MAFENYSQFSGFKIPPVIKHPGPPDWTTGASRSSKNDRFLRMLQKEKSRPNLHEKCKNTLFWSLSRLKFSRENGVTLPSAPLTTCVPFEHACFYCRTLVCIVKFLTSVIVFILGSGAISAPGGCAAFARFSTRFPLLVGALNALFATAFKFSIAHLTFSDSPFRPLKASDFSTFRTPSYHSSRTGVFLVFLQKEIGFF